MSTIAWDFPDPFTLTMTVTPEHIDEFRHTNNVVYLKWLEMLAWEHSRHLGLDWPAYERLGQGMVARRHELDYLAPSFEGESLLLGTWILYTDKLTIRRAYQFIRPADGAVLFRGRTLWVCVDLKTGKVRRMPAEFQEAYRSPLQLVEAGS